MPGMGTTGRVNITVEMMNQAIRSIEDYQSSVKSLNDRLQTAVDGLIPSSFSGSAAEGFKSFYTTRILPNITENLDSMLKGLTDICTAIRAQIPGAEQGVDDQLGQVNKNPGGGN